MSGAKFRWGILGLGNIAHKFAEGLTVLPDHELVAVGSRTQEKADEFGAKYGAASRYASYEALVADPNVDAVYVATPHPMHKEDSLLCINAGKAVLCEKPFAINSADTQAVLDAGRKANVFVMEAMWTRFFPLMAEVRKLVTDGAIGEPRMIMVDFGFRAGIDPSSRLFNLALGGGGLLDVGVYTVSFSSMIFGAPTQVAGVATIGETGVDEQCGLVLGHGGGEISMLSSAVRTNTPHEATIVGTDGRIKVNSMFWNPRSFTLTAGGKDELREFPIEGNGYQFEAIEVGNCVRAGKLESDILPHSETLSVMKTLDTVRAQWGLKYPGE